MRILRTQIHEVHLIYRIRKKKTVCMSKYLLRAYHQIFYMKTLQTSMNCWSSSFHYRKLHQCLHSRKNWESFSRMRISLLEKRRRRGSLTENSMQNSRVYECVRGKHSWNEIERKVFVAVESCWSEENYVVSRCRVLFVQIELIVVCFTHNKL